MPNHPDDAIAPGNPSMPTPAIFAAIRNVPETDDVLCAKMDSSTGGFGLSRFISDSFTLRSVICSVSILGRVKSMLGRPDWSKSTPGFDCTFSCSSIEPIVSAEHSPMKTTIPARTERARNNRNAQLCASQLHKTRPHTTRLGKFLSGGGEDFLNGFPKRSFFFWQLVLFRRSPFCLAFWWRASEWETPHKWIATLSCKWRF